MKGWNKYITFIISLLICSTSVFAQSKADLEKKRSRQEKEIQYTKKLIAETHQKHTKTLQFLKVINKQIYNRQALINTISQEIDYLDEQIEMNNDILFALKRDLENLKKEYASMVQFAYKNRNPYNKIGFILSAETVNQSFKRLKLLQHYSEFRKKQMKLIGQTKSSIEKKVLSLQVQKTQKKDLLAKETNERKNLINDKKKQATVVNTLKHKEKDLKKQLKKKERIAAELDKAIEAFIVSKGTYESTPEAKQLSKEFVQNKGKLPWPVENGFISEKFGKHEHPTLKGIYVFNNGVKIRTAKGSEARAVFKGEVLNIVYIPGAGISILVRHGIYFTVYSNLAEVYVKVGQNVTTKQSIGKIRFNSNTGDTEIDIWMWKNTTKLDPIYWLFPK